jgi:fibronectin-binding autotransporter adhesin
MNRNSSSTTTPHSFLGRPAGFACLALLLLTLINASAADRWWDGGTANISGTGDGASAGGAGTWNLTTTNWDQGSGLPFINWVNANVDNAIFGGAITTAKTITLSSAVTINTLRSTTTAYTIGAVGSGPITFGGTYDSTTPAPTIDTTGGATVNSFTVAAKITGTLNGGLVVKDISDITAPAVTSRVYLSCTTNDFVGDITVLSGNLHILSGLGNAANKIYLKGGALFGLSGATITYTNNRTIIVSADSAIGTAPSSGTTQTWLMNGAITGAANLTRYYGSSGTANLLLQNDMSAYAGTFANNGGNLIISNTVTSAGGWVLNGGTLTFSTANDTHIANGAGKADLVVNGGVLNMNGKNETINGLSGTGGFVQNNLASTTSTLMLGDNNATATFSGTVRDNGGAGGTLAVTKIGNGTQTLAGASAATGGFTITAGILEFGDGATDPSISGPITNNAALRINAAGSVTYAGNLTAGSGTLTKGGSGALALTGTNSYTGATFISAGKLVLMTTRTGGPIYVGGGAELEVKRHAAGAALAATSASADSSTLTFNFNSLGMGTNAPLNVSGAFTNNGYTTVQIVNPGTYTVGSYPLVKYGSYVSNAYSSFNLTVLSTGVEAHLANNPGNSSIDLVVDSLSSFVWSGATDTNWDTATINWILNPGAVATNYANGSSVRFDDTGSNTTITVSGPLSPNSILVSNNTKAYIFGGGGSLSGSGVWTKSGAGTMTLGNIFVSRPGGMAIKAGSVNVGDGTNDPSLVTDIQNDGSLVFNVTGTQNPSGVISGTGTVSKTGPGVLTLNGNNTYTGATTISAGRVDLAAASALGTTANGTTVSSGAELHLTTGLTITEPLILGGSGISGTGAFSVDSGVSYWTAPVTLTGDTLMTMPNNVTMEFDGGLNGGGHALVLNPTTTSAGGAFTFASSITNVSTLVLSNTVNLGGLFLNTANDSLTNVLVYGPVAGGAGALGYNGLWVLHDHALGTNTAVTLVNSNSTAAPGTRMVLNNNGTIPAGVSLELYAPGDGDVGPGIYRASLYSYAVATNTWNGPINLRGSVTDGYYPLIQFYCQSGNIILNGPVGFVGGIGELLLRGATGTGMINNTINLGTNNLRRADSATWVIGSTGNTWREAYWNYGTFQIAANNAFCTNAPVRLVFVASASGNPRPYLDLNGFNQRLPGLYTSGSGSAFVPAVINGSTNTDSTLALSSAAGSNWVYAGVLENVTGAKALNLEVAGSDPLTLTAAGNNYTGSTTIRTHATLALSGDGNISASTPIDVQAGGTFDVSGTTSGGFTVAASQTLMGNGTVNGSLTNNGTLAPGESIGHLTITTNATLGLTANTIMEVNNATHTNDLLTVGGTLTYNGTLLITNVSGAGYTNNQVLKLFDAGTYAPSAFASIVFPGTGSYDASNLAVDGTIKVTSLPSTLPTTPTNITFSVTGGGSQMQLLWPASYTGWLLQSNAVSVANSNSWFTVPGSAATNEMFMTISLSSGNIFYRLRYP